jgi:hypothetical protein
MIFASQDLKTASPDGWSIPSYTKNEVVSAGCEKESALSTI